MATSKTQQYIEAIGRRKTATARVRLTKAKDYSLTVNDKAGGQYFVTPELQSVVRGPFVRTEIIDSYTITVKVSGGGIHSQAEAVRHGISRALVAINAESRVELKHKGFLKRDPRAKERRKAGNAGKARAKKQWSKR
jgi:small subunit ribosomal protein S9